jgi:hypothetical protein
MRAFALPTYSEGLVRINVAGREGCGKVAPARFGETCDELTSLLSGLTDGRSGRPMVREIIRTRGDPFADGAPADLIVLWQEDAPTDLVESPRIGRIGPLPFFRTGGHSSQGFMMARRPDLQPGSRLRDIAAQDLTRLLLNQLA